MEKFPLAQPRVAQIVAPYFGRKGAKPHGIKTFIKLPRQCRELEVLPCDYDNFDLYTKNAVEYRYGRKSTNSLIQPPRDFFPKVKPAKISEFPVTATKGKH